MPLNRSRRPRRSDAAGCSWKLRGPGARTPSAIRPSWTRRSARASSGAPPQTGSGSSPSADPAEPGTPAACAALGPRRQHPGPREHRLGGSRRLRGLPHRSFRSAGNAVGQHRHRGVRTRAARPVLRRPRTNRGGGPAKGRPRCRLGCSHIGGDRFAATMLLLPHGINYGWADTLGAQHMVNEYRAGRVVWPGCAAAARSGSSSRRLRTRPAGHSVTCVSRPMSRSNRAT